MVAGAAPIQPQQGSAAGSQGGAAGGMAAGNKQLATGG
jgi:hypothetical protein